MDINHLIATHPSIKIVPSMDDHLRTLGLNTDLDDSSKLWFEQLKQTWKVLKKSPTVEKQIESFFVTKPDPHRLALVFATTCDELKDCKPKTLPYFIIETLNKWAQVHKILPDDLLKLPAFHVGIQRRNPHFLNLILKTYQVHTIKDEILPILRDMIRKDNSKQASQIVVTLGMSEDIPVEELMFPFVLQDKPNMLDDYLSQCPSQVRPFLDFLDKLLNRKMNVLEYVQQFVGEYNVCNVKYEKIHYKPLGKLVARLCNKFKIPIETCKNLSKNRTSSGLRYLVHQRYLEHNVSSAVWDDLVKDSLKINSEAGIDFIDILVDYDKPEALKWAAYLNIPKDNLPLAIKDISVETNTVTEEENWDDCTNTNEEYYKLSLPFEQISIIDTPEKFYELVFSVLSNCHVVSMDCEWKPSFGATQQQVALIQVATLDQVYLIDVMLMNNQNYSSSWYSFYKSFLDNAEIIKMGFGFETDLREIKGSVMGLSNIKVKGEGLLDLGLLWKSLISSGLVLPRNTDSAGQSLSSVVQSCFGLPLEKSEQCSNWELRPLRKTQIEYAALDAYVLIEIYNYLQRLSLQQGINFEEICNDVMLDKKIKPHKKTKATIESVQPKVTIHTVHNVKFLVEPQLYNLMSYLRYCGIDATGLPSTILWHDVINLAISEGRYLLLTKLKCSPHVNYPQSHILDVGKTCIKLQIQKIINYFNIVIRQSDILSRCIYCNSIDVKMIESGEVHNICDNFKTMSNSLHQTNYRSSEHDDYGHDEYEDFLNDDDDDDEVDLYQPVCNVQNNVISKTSQGVPIEILNLSKMSISTESAILCESCGRLINKENDELLKSVSDLIYSVTNLSY